MKLYIIRHGDPNYKDDCLTPLGKRQAEALAKRFATTRLDKIYSSPLGRARETAKPTCEVLRKELTILDFVSENALYSQISVPNGDRRRWCFQEQETNYKNNETVRMYDDWSKACPTFDSDEIRAGIERIGRESDEFLKTLGYERDGCVYKILTPSEENVAVFCHQGAGLTWLSHLLQIPPHIYWATFDMSHTGVTIIEFRNHQNGITTPKCIMFSDLSHIYMADLPRKFNNGTDI